VNYVMILPISEGILAQRSCIGVYFWVLESFCSIPLFLILFWYNQTYEVESASCHMFRSVLLLEVHVTTVLFCIFTMSHPSTIEDSYSFQILIA
jgi:hypothetical protein